MKQVADMTIEEVQAALRRRRRPWSKPLGFPRQLIVVKSQKRFLDRI